MEASSGSIDSDCSNHDPKGYGGATMGARGQIFYMGIYMEEYFWKLSSKKNYAQKCFNLCGSIRLVQNKNFGS